MVSRIKADECVFVVVDIQQKLAPAMWAGDEVIQQNYKLLQASSRLNIAQVITEQYPAGIGQTVDLLQPLIKSEDVIEKMTFSCMGEDKFSDKLTQLEKKQVVVSGMETHVCVLQTVLDLIDAGYQVFVVEDCVASRSTENKRLGLERMRQCGAQIVTSEMVMFEWLGRAGTEDFKAILPLIK